MQAGNLKFRLVYGGKVPERGADAAPRSQILTETSIGQETIMPFDTWLAFVVTATIILVIPGPTIIFVIGQSLAHGPKTCLPLAAGVILGDTVCIILSLVGLGTVLTLFSAAFTLIKLLGAAYLIYLGIAMIRSAREAGGEKAMATGYSPRTVFRDIFVVNALNPKGIVFFSAFMPQFVDPGAGIIAQLLILGITFLGLAFVNVMGYSLLAGQMNRFFREARRMRIFRISGGLCMICAGIYAATARQR